MTKEEKDVYFKEYRLKNRDKIRERNKLERIRNKATYDAYYEAHKEEKREYNKLWRQENPKYHEIAFKNRTEEENERNREVHRQYLKNNPEKVQTYTKEHYSSSPQLKYRETMEFRLERWRSGAKKRSKEWSDDITLEYLKSLPLICFYTKRELTFKQGHFNTISLDRIDNTKGYIKGNIVFCCKGVNIAKHIMTAEEFVKMSGEIWNNKEKILNLPENVV